MGMGNARECICTAVEWIDTTLGDGHSEGRVLQVVVFAISIYVRIGRASVQTLHACDTEIRFLVPISVPTWLQSTVPMARNTQSRQPRRRRSPRRVCIEFLDRKGLRGTW